MITKDSLDKQFENIDTLIKGYVKKAKDSIKGDPSPANIDRAMDDLEGELEDSANLTKRNLEEASQADDFIKISK